MGEFFRVERSGHVAVVTLDRPPVNALSLGVLAELEEVMADLNAAGDVRAVILTATGEKFFAAGADINQLPELDGPTGRQLNHRFQTAFNQVAAFPQPVIAAVNGLALGGGSELALAADIRIASERASFGLPEARLGLIPGGGGTQRLPRLLPPGKAKELMFTGRRLSAAEALQWGLVEQVVPPAELLPVAIALAEEIARQAPVAVRMIKAAVNGGLDRPLAAGLQWELDCSVKCFESWDFREGVRAFLEKRPPEFVGL